MTKEQIAVFEQLLKDESFKGRKELRHLLWLNTAKPKFKNGECFKVTDPGHKIFGHLVLNFNAMIVRTFSWRDTDEWHYELQMVCDCNGSRRRRRCTRAKKIWRWLSGAMATRMSLEPQKASIQNHLMRKQRWFIFLGASYQLVICNTYGGTK